MAASTFDERGRVAPAGTHSGERVPGSKYFRQFCSSCHAPIRSSDGRRGVRIPCRDCCEPERRIKLQVHEYVPTGEASGSFENGVRALEGG